MASKKRKRRSFWEPDSPQLNAWLDAQTDLGTSLQLIIVDAIQKYGEGDVIKSYLTRREVAFRDGEAPEKQDDNQATYTIEGTGSEVGLKTPKKEVKKAPAKEEALSLDLADDDNETPFDVGAAIGRAVDEKDANEKAGNEEDYDPIAIMMGDIGSKLDK